MDMNTDESKAIEASEQRESDYFQKVSRNNTRNPFEADEPNEPITEAEFDNITELLRSNPWDKK